MPSKPAKRSPRRDRPVAFDAGRNVIDQFEGGSAPLTPPHGRKPTATVSRIRRRKPRSAGGGKEGKASV